MKYTIQDTEYYSWIEMFPETAEEMALLLRLTNNTLRETPAISTFFSHDKPSCMVQFKKKSSSHTNSFITNHE